MIPPMLLDAVYFAAEAHAKQRRKYTDEAYINHCLRVMNTTGRLLKFGYGSSAAMAVAVLHDTVEDTPTGYADIKRLFGDWIADGVMALTELPAGGWENRAARKEDTRRRLAQAHGHIQVVKCADIMDNLPSICEHEPRFAMLMMTECEALLDVMQKMPPGVQAETQAFIHQYREKVVNSATSNG